MFYDYKSEENVQDVVLECFCPLVEDIEDEFLNLRRGEDLSIYAPSPIAEIIAGRICEEIDGTYFDKDSETYLLGEDEDIVITLGFDGRIFIEKARGNNGKFKDNFGDALTYVYDEYTKKDIDSLWEDDESVLVFGFEEECFELENPDVELENYVDEDGDLHGFHLSTGDGNNYHSISLYSTGDIEENIIGKIIELLYK